LIEGDLRRPRVAQYLGLEGGVGLTDALVRQSSVEDFIQPWGEDGLAFLASGSTPPNPSELLGSAPMKDLLVSLRGRFDRIVIDAPPLLPVTDAVVASTLADGVVFIIRHGKTTRRQVAAAALALRPVQARILGSVLNMRKVNHREAVAYGTDVAYYSDPEPDWQQPRRTQMGPAESSQATTAA
jgi:capsular exopolysaccharide synthesis family protein